MMRVDADAPCVVEPVAVSALVSLPEMSPLTPNAPRKIYLVSFTGLVSHPEMSALNADAS